jgi:hypothetical protein
LEENGTVTAEERGNMSRRLVLRAVLFVVPLLTLAAWLYLQPGDRLFSPQRSSLSARGLVYNPDDLTVLAERSLNAELGRKAGRLDPPALTNPAEFNALLDADPPLAERYFLEYPHLAELVSRVPWKLHGELPPVPTAVADADSDAIVVHQPRNPDELRLWSAFAWATRFYACLMTACLLALMLLLERGYGPNTGLWGTAALLVLPGALFFSLNRYDILPALLTAVALACVGRGRLTASAVALALAALLKVYPVLLAPLVLRYVATDWRRGLGWCAAFGLTLLVGGGWPLLVGQDLVAVLGPYRFQLSREGQPFMMMLYGWVLPGGLASGMAGKVFRLGTVAAALALFCWRRPGGLASVVRRGAVVVILFANLSVFYSPQWIIWFSPLLLPLVRLHRRLAWGVIALDLVTYLTYPVYSSLSLAPHRVAWLVGEGHAEAVLYAVRVALIYARFAALAFLLWTLLRAEYGRGRAAVEESPQAAGELQPV